MVASPDRKLVPDFSTAPTNTRTAAPIACASVVSGRMVAADWIFPKRTRYEEMNCAFAEQIPTLPLAAVMATPAICAPVPSVDTTKPVAPITVKPH